jgi:xylulokinase
MKHIIGLDIGTSGTKAAIYTEKGDLVAAHTVEYPLDTPQPGWSEQNPQLWWGATIEALHAVMAQSSIDKDSCAGLGLSGQMHGSVFIDSAGKPVRPAILWNDGRTEAECAEIAELLGEEILTRTTCNPPLTGFTAPKALWLRKHEPEHFAKTAHLLLPKDYIRYKLTGELACEPSDAAGTLLFDVPANAWSTVVLDKLSIPREWMPPIVASASVAGKLRKDIAEATGLPAGLPIAAGGADNACAAVGTGAIKTGQGIVSIGTSGTVVTPVGEIKMDPQQRVHTFNHAVSGTWYLMGVVLSAGLSYRWLRDEICKDLVTQNADTYDLMTQLASDVTPGSEGLVFLPYLMGERSPHKNPNAKGMLFGLTYRHHREHIIRATLEGITFALKDSLMVIRGLRVDPNQLLATGGGGKSPFWRQLLADILDCPIARLDKEEGAALGAAILGGVAGGVYSSIEEATSTILKVVEVCEPSKDIAAYEDTYQTYRALYPATSELM